MDNGHTTTHEFYSCVRVRVEPVQRTGFTLYTNYKCYIGPLHPNNLPLKGNMPVGEKKKKYSKYTMIYKTNTNLKMASSNTHE